MNTPLPDITSPAEIVTLVDTFYERIRSDNELGPIFNEIAQVNWSTHLPRMYAFWEKVLFGTGTFQGNPLAVHARLVPLTDMGREKFDRWLTLFTATVDSLFAGEKAGHIKRAAEDMANVIYSKINNVPDPRFNPANHTPKQRERYAQYRKNTSG